MTTPSTSLNFEPVGGLRPLTLQHQAASFPSPHTHLLDSPTRKDEQLRQVLPRMPQPGPELKDTHTHTHPKPQASKLQKATEGYKVPIYSSIH